MITVFEDAYTGARYKTPYGTKKIVILADQDKAVKIFEYEFGRNPIETECDCCYSSDFFISEWESVEDFMNGEIECEMVVFEENYIELNEKWNR